MGAGTQTVNTSQKARYSSQIAGSRTGASICRSERGPASGNERGSSSWRAASHIACAVGAVLAEKLDAALLDNGGEKKGEKRSTLCVTLDSGVHGHVM
jgi:hypothetical protein